MPHVLLWKVFCRCDEVHDLFILSEIILATWQGVLSQLKGLEDRAEASRRRRFHL